MNSSSNEHNIPQIERMIYTDEGTRPAAVMEERRAVPFAAMRLRFQFPALRAVATNGKLLAILIVVAVSALVSMAFPAGATDAEAAPIFGITIPPGYRDWKLISVAHEEGNLNDLRAILGNDPGIKAYRNEQMPFPDGTIIARLAWKYVSSEENNKVFGRNQSFVAGPPTNIQFMVKDSKKYATTGGWGFAQFRDGKPDDKADLRTCFPCHEPVKARDFVFTRYAP